MDNEQVYSNCCGELPNPLADVTNNIGLCSKCGEWAKFATIEELEKEDE